MRPYHCSSGHEVEMALGCCDVVLSTLRAGGPWIIGPGGGVEVGLVHVKGAIAHRMFLGPL